WWDVSRANQAMTAITNNKPYAANYLTTIGNHPDIVQKELNKLAQKLALVNTVRYELGIDADDGTGSVSADELVSEDFIKALGEKNKDSPDSFVNAFNRGMLFAIGGGQE